LRVCHPQPLAGAGSANTKIGVAKGVAFCPLTALTPTSIVCSTSIADRLHAQITRLGETKPIKKTMQRSRLTRLHGVA
jgi:hypothetical protein